MIIGVDINFYNRESMSSKLMRKNAIAKIPFLCAVSVRATVLDPVVDEEADGVVARTALGWILASKKNGSPSGVVKN